MKNATELLKEEAEKMKAKGTVEEALTEQEMNDYVGGLLNRVITEKETLERSVEHWKSEFTKLQQETNDRRLWELVLVLTPSIGRQNPAALIANSVEILSEFNSYVEDQRKK